MRGEHSPISTCSPSRKSIFSTNFYYNLNMYFVIFPHGTWIYYILFITWSILLHSLYTLYVCRVWRTLPDYLINIFIIKKLCNLNLIKRLLCHLSDICYKCHTWNSKFYLLFGSSYNFTPIKKCGSKKHVQPIKNCWNKIIYSDIPRLLKCINKD